MCHQTRNKYLWPATTKFNRLRPNTYKFRQSPLPAYSWLMVGGLPNESVLEHIIDVHCHPTDASPISLEAVESLQITICAMSTMHSNQPLVRELAIANPAKVIPCFGHHPWFTHQISMRPSISKEEHYKSLFLPDSSPSKELILAFERLLPVLADPIPLDAVLSELRSNLNAFPQAMLGEVGLDTLFHIPYDYHATPREPTPFQVPFNHQLVILEAQLDLAVEMGRNVSIHSVKAPLATLDLFEKMKTKHGQKWENINVDIHSCSMSPETWRDIERKNRNVYLSLSTAVNGRSKNHKALIAACDPDRLLAESDFNNIEMCAERTWDMIKTIASVRGWHLESDWYDDSAEESKQGTVHRLEKNWATFQSGGAQRAAVDGYA